jgi:hypothetical protein
MAISWKFIIVSQILWDFEEITFIERTVVDRLKRKPGTICNRHILIDLREASIPHKEYKKTPQVQQTDPEKLLTESGQRGFFRQPPDQQP